MHKNFFLKFFNLLLVLPALTCVAFLSVANAAENSPEAHEHGVGNLNIVLQADEIEFELEIPSENIVGFEHLPETPQEKNKVQEAVSKLRQGNRLFAFPKGTGCRLEKADIDSSLIGKDNHSHEKHDNHNHDDSHQHQEEETSGGGGHSEFSAIYHFDCDKMDQMNYVIIEFFSFFPSTEKMRVQFVHPNGQGATEITAGSPKVVFR